MLDFWGKVPMEWGFMLLGSDLPLFRLYKVDWMVRRFMLCYIYDYLLVYSDGNIPWIFRLCEAVGMVGKYF